MKLRHIVKENIEEISLAAFSFLTPGRTALSFGQTFRELIPFWKNRLTPGAVEFFPVDERSVPLNHEESNWGNLSRLLFNPGGDVISPENFASSAEQYRTLLARKFKSAVPVFDVIYLGIGLDGHTASLFPGQTYPADAVVLETRSPAPPFSRITLSPRVITAARTVVFVVTSPDKKEILDRVLSLEPGLPAVQILKSGVNTVLITPENLTR